MTGQWPPNYVDKYAWRQAELIKMRSDPVMLVGAKEFYRTRPVEFITDWIDTHDPRNAGKKGMLTSMPFIMFQRQCELIQFLQSLLENDANGLVEKCRDAGATWGCVGFSVWMWLFMNGVSVGWGSRKEMYVDKIGVMDSIFEKIRAAIRDLPREFKPEGFSPKDHMTYMRVMNPANNSTIIGEAGDNIGRGGRTRIYFKDESAHYERPELVEASLGDNTRCQVDISSVNGTGNVFHRKRLAGVEWGGGAADPDETNIFIFDWRQHPAKTQEWYDKRKRRYENEGLAHIFAQEVDRDYSASVEGVIIKPEWVEACVDAHIKLGIDPVGKRISALDVADDGDDKNAHVSRRGFLIDYADSWAAPDVGVTARKCIKQVGEFGEPVQIQYDAIGVGAGVKSEANRLVGERIMPTGLSFTAWVASAKPLDPDKPIIEKDKQAPLNKDHYSNLKAQAWSVVARRFFKTWQAITLGHKISPDDLIALDSNMRNLHTLKSELSQATASLSSSTMRVVVDKSPKGTKSPNMADAAVMCAFPVKKRMFSMSQVG